MFLEQFFGQMGRGPRRLSPEAIQALRSHRWPGNVRELKNAVERGVVLGQNEEMSAADLGLVAADLSLPMTGALVSLRDVERQHIEYVLARCNGNKTQACRILGIGRATLYAKLGEGTTDALVE
jgi:DNA-binding NtrC family response regulator